MQGAGGQAPPPPPLPPPPPSETQLLVQLRPSLGRVMFE